MVCEFFHLKLDGCGCIHQLRDKNIRESKHTGKAPDPWILKNPLSSEGD